MVSQIYLVLISLAAILLVHRSLRYFSNRSNHLPLPPGPPGLPLIGNLHQAPKSRVWAQWHAWAKEYGPVVYLNMLGQPLVILNSAKAAQDLLARRGAIYSDRPRLVLAGELALKGLHLLLMPYDAQYKASSYRPLLHLESRQLLSNILKESKKSPQGQGQGQGQGQEQQARSQQQQQQQQQGVNHHHQLERATASTTYALIYGYRLLTGHEPEHARAHEIQKQFAAMMVGPNLVDLVPCLQGLPFPWPWKARAERHFREQRDLHLANLHRALDNSGWNFAKEMAASAERGQMGEEEFAFDLGILADAALETTVISASWFVVAWLAHGGGTGTGTTGTTGFVAKAQRCLDDVVGRDRLPDFDDRPRLPYIDAIVEEVLRWRPIGTTGVPHLTKVEDRYEGRRIPAGSIVFANQWAIARDVEVFGEDVDDFVPERWLVDGAGAAAGDGTGGGGGGENGGDDVTTDGGDKEEKSSNSEDCGAGSGLRDLPSIGFGFGRRACTGRYVARSVLWIQIAMLLWAFDLEGAVSRETGEKVEVDPMAMTDSLVIRPVPFDVLFKARGPWVEEVIQKQCDTLDVDLVDLLDKIGDYRASRP
ncbi:hypothetical protein VMCG_04577 [Cytospora schulzeri]|uniref:Cytochrome P450 n=1 Tax=Cytospora schulzeri TaxID=448051 RepID=A0A423WSL3_9PEZI|nr:hypothetical protein VMCG_04577 [Valsa malicola]